MLLPSSAEDLRHNSGKALAHPLMCAVQDTVPGMKTPAYLLSASSAEDSPHVSGKSNPVTNFKEGKPVRAHSTPFEDRCVPCLLCLLAADIAS